MKLPNASGDLAPHLSAPAAPRLRLEFLDGLRGLAAFYVVLFHACQLVTFTTTTINPNLVWRAGHLAVSVFIVLSGFCLMLPVARSESRELRGGASEYLKRRAQRILPPYYAALVLSCFFLAAAHWVKYRGGAALNDRVLAVHLSLGSLVSHLLLIHNWSPRWAETIDVPMWSVATEWQLYFFLPVLLLPMWRRFGVWAMVASGFAIGLLPHYLLTPKMNFDWACPWYLGLFATGAAGAAAGFSPALAGRSRRVPWGGLAGLLFALLGGAVLFAPDALLAECVWETDALAGAGTTCLILWCTIRTTATVLLDTPRPAVLQGLEAPWTLRLGAFSYSLYLVHYPILNKIAQVLDACSLTLSQQLLLIYGIGVPVALGFSFLFYLAFERRFSIPATTARQPEVTLR